MRITLLISNQVKDGKENKCKYIYMLKLSIIKERLLYKIICGNGDYGKKLLLSFFKYMYHALFTTCMPVVVGPGPTLSVWVKSL